MNFRNTSKMLIFLGIIIFPVLPVMLKIFFFFILVIWIIVPFFSKNNFQKKDLRDILSDEFGDLFGVKRTKPITVNEVKKKSPFSVPPLRMPNHFGKIIFLGIVGFFGILIVIDGFISVSPGYVAVIFDRGRGVLPKPEREGLHLKIPFWQESTQFQTVKQEFTMAGEYEGEKDVDGVRGRSKDGQDVFVDVTITYQISPEDAPFLRQQFINEERYKYTIIQPAARSVVYDAIGKFNALELISDKRTDFTDFIAKSLQEIYGENRIQFREVFVRKITFSPEFASAIEEKVIAEQRIKTAENRKLEAEELKKKTIIEAEGEAEAIRLKGESLHNNSEVIQFQFVEKMAPEIKWGILPNSALPLLDIKDIQQ
ncbi:prohibitin family protein [Candidatus Peregrinibacteria bacterium]|nr:MAG: prohibitin family protein [Candidatus Peregrinibacteria bacterium]